MRPAKLIDLLTGGRVYYRPSRMERGAWYPATYAHCNDDGTHVIRVDGEEYWAARGEHRPFELRLKTAVALDLLWVDDANDLWDQLCRVGEELGLEHDRRTDVEALVAEVRTLRQAVEDHARAGLELAKQLEGER